MFKIWISLLFILLLSFAINNTINAGITAEDWNRHGPWTEALLAGKPIPLSVYPPAFHIFMAPFVWLFGDQIAWMQIVLAALVNFTLLFIVHKYHGQTATLVMAILMLSNLCFLIYYDSLTPQTLDIVLFPIFMHLLITKRYALAILPLVFIGYSHQFGFVFLVAATIYSLVYKREFIKFLMVAYILLIPMIYFQFVPFVMQVLFDQSAIRAIIPNSGMVNVDYQMFATAETLYFEQPLNLLAFTGFTLPLALYTIYRLFKDRKTYKLSDSQKFYIIWAICFIPALYFSIWRGMSYEVVPLMLLTASLFTNRENRL